MSLNRLLFRTLTVAALTQQDYDAAPPTIAGEAVFDSRLDPIEFDTDKIEVPIATVYTEEDQLTLLDRGAGRGAYHRTITLRIDICVGSFQKSVENKQTKIAYSIPTTDAELEAVLDLFEGRSGARSTRQGARSATCGRGSCRRSAKCPPAPRARSTETTGSPRGP